MNNDFYLWRVRDPFRNYEWIVLDENQAYDFSRYLDYCDTTIIWWDNE